MWRGEKLESGTNVGRGGPLAVSAKKDTLPPPCTLSAGEGRQLKLPHLSGRLRRPSAARKLRPARTPLARSHPARAHAHAPPARTAPWRMAAHRREKGAPRRTPLDAGPGAGGLGLGRLGSTPSPSAGGCGATGRGCASMGEGVPS